MNTGVLTLRTQDVGGEMRREIYPLKSPDRARTWLVFIHGFRTRPTQAREQLRELHRRSEPALRAVDIAWVTVLWPSDVSESRTLSRGCYGQSLDTIDRAGNRLADYLHDNAPANLVLVGYSLGAGVALTALTRLDQRRHRPPVGLSLLGAAVRVSDLADDGRFSLPLAARESVTVNPDDRTLAQAFPIAERLATPAARAARAVGLHGEPVDRGWTQVPLSGSSHKVYLDDRVATALTSAFGERSAEPESRAVAGHTVEGRDLAD
jgi:pimeloyl-ACP methyl ester carboxylesterase